MPAGGAPKRTAKRLTKRGKPARGRPPVISTERLLDVAREVFLEHGIRATTATVAARAGVSEGTIFHRFSSKDALFRAAMRFDPEELPTLLASLAGRVGEADLRATLLEVGGRVLEVGRVALPVMMMSWSNPESDLSLPKAIQRGEGYRRAFRGVRAFFEGEIAAGRLGGSGPEIFARLFMGSLHHFCLGELFLLDEGDRAMTGASFVEGLVDTLLRAGRYDERATGSGGVASKRRRSLSRL
jgi:AcrR family transcriptional regulator